MKNILIGIDGGATKINAHLVEMADKKSFSLTDTYAEKQYETIPGYLSDFTPINLQAQLKDFKNTEFHLSDDEIQQGAVLIEACAQIIESITKETKCTNIIVGIGMPGLKTVDSRGIAVLANGPRMPKYIEELEKRLEMGGINFVQPIKRIGSDADYCGIGENYSENGLFKKVENAYYIGLGTGVADALKLKGTLLPFDQTKKWLAKTWEMKTNDDISLESIISARGIRRIYEKYSKKTVNELNKSSIYADTILKLADDNDAAALKSINTFTNSLSDLIFERISTLYSGWQELFSFVNPNRESLSPNHPYRSQLFDKIIIGQRIGIIMESDLGKKYLVTPLFDNLSKKIKDAPFLDSKAKSHYANLNNIIDFSNLRAAPVLGAAIDAILYGDENA
jgi:predicted NBD/HSP70 family sugar kinase